MKITTNQMRGEYRNGKIRHTRRTITARAPYISKVTVEYDVLPDIGLIEGNHYEFELFSNRAIVKIPGPSPSERRSRAPRLLP